MAAIFVGGLHHSGNITLIILLSFPKLIQGRSQSSMNESSGAILLLQTYSIPPTWQPSNLFLKCYFELMKRRSAMHHLL